MFGLVKTEEKTILADNNDIREYRKRKEKIFTITFFIIALILINLALYLMTNS